MADEPSTDRGLLHIDRLTKRYRRLVAVDEFSLDVAAGEFVGFIGPNGAGKSTTMGFVPQELDLYEYLTGEEFLRFVANVRGVEGSAQDEQVDELLELTELTDARDRVVKEYSGGMARKIAICAALIGPPELLLLDEAFVGLDPESTWRIRKHLQAFCDDGGAILLSSHILDMLERICSRVIIMVDGQLSRDLSRDELDGLLEAGEYPDLNAIYLEATGKELV